MRRLRPPGNLVDCGRINRLGTEIFIIEGQIDGSAKPARDREI